MAREETGSRWDRVSEFDVPTTIDRLEAAIVAFGGIERIARVDQARVAGLGGVETGPAEQLVLENPELVARLAEVDPALLVDLPIRVLAWENAEGVVRVRTAPPAQLAASSDHPQVQGVRDTIEQVLGGWLDRATAATPDEGRPS